MEAIVDFNILQDLPKEIIFGSVGIFIVGYSIWFLFFRPFNLVKDYTEYGYDSSTGRNVGKRKRINLALQRRKIGQLPPPYPNSWYAILESDELVSGQVKEVYVLGQNLVAWRGRLNGKVNVSDAYCPHLGAHLGVGGTVQGDCIQCPFHKWTFESETGSVKNIPYCSESQSKEKLPGLKTWKSVETNGFIYIWHHVKGHQPTWFPEPVEQFASGKRKYHGRSEFEVTCHIQEIPENGADVSHLNALHQMPAFFGGRLQLLTNLLEKVFQHKWSATWAVNEDKKHEALVSISHHLSFFGDKLNVFHINVSVKQIGAGIVIMEFMSSFGRGTLVQSVTPVEPMLQKVSHRFYSESRFLHPFGLLVLQSEAVQISRDIEIWNRKCFLRQPALVKEDAQIKLFRRWFSQFYSDDKWLKADNHSESNVDELLMLL